MIENEETEKSYFNIDENIKDEISDDHNIFYVYKIINMINDKKYIGYTTNFETRIYRHDLSARRGKVNPAYRDYYATGRAINKHGIENFTATVIHTAKTEKEAWFLEVAAIKRYKSLVNQNGYNIAHGGQGGKKKTIKAQLSGKNHPLYGRTIPQEAKDNISKAHKERESLKGETNPGAKLNDAIVSEILKVLEENNLSFEGIGKRFGVTGSCIKNIYSGISWKHVFRSSTLHPANGKRKIPKLKNHKLKTEQLLLSPPKDVRIQSEAAKKQLTTRTKAVAKNGYSAGYAKLDGDKVKFIRASFANKLKTINELAHLYGMTTLAIKMVVLRQTWKHVE